eukprot:1197966-Prymnesium_polylepis.1
MVLIALCAREGAPRSGHRVPVSYREVFARSYCRRAFALLLLPHPDTMALIGDSLGPPSPASSDGSTILEGAARSAPPALYLRCTGCHGCACIRRSNQAVHWPGDSAP